MKYAFASALAAILAIPGVAQAQSFEGPFVGAQAGWNRDEVGRARTDAGQVRVDSNRDAFVGGAFAGYDHELAKKVVIGVEGGFAIAADDRVAGSAYSIDPHYTFDITGRAGYVVGDKTLLYVRGGYANSRARVRGSDGVVAVNENQTFDGWLVGGGVERKLLDRVSARAEYRYNDLGSADAKYDRHQVLVGVAYRF